MVYKPLQIRKVTIEYTADRYEYQILKGGSDFDEYYKENDQVMELVRQLFDSASSDERREIADELWELCDYECSAVMLYPEGQLQISDPVSKEPALSCENMEVLDDDYIPFREYFANQTATLPFCIIRNSYGKRAHYCLTAELDEPFSAEFLIIDRGSLFYQGEEFEFTGDAGGWIEDRDAYVFGAT